ncbi:chaplin [Streptomyces sp. PT12]|uniref:chaplin n=1 Tax=Streptomyces sp. PT12 TaxID=1510197 RepID=UPI000DE35878|nr:chaplin [Streptomyces sp. PT12]RBM17006.1 chaplin [Streptomyces sp. PT12]
MNTAKKVAFVLAATGAVVGTVAGAASADSAAAGGAVASPGVLSGNLLQVPLSIEPNITGNTLNLVGLLNPAFANTGVIG